MNEEYFNLVVAGSRSFRDFNLMSGRIEGFIRNNAPDRSVRILSGHARGADLLGEWYARENGFELLVFRADWDTHGKAAGPIRNSEMIERADGLIVFWNGRSRGTKDCLMRARRKGIPCEAVIF